MDYYKPFSNFHEVLPNLYIGNSIDASNKDLLKSKGIGSILIVASELEPLYPEDFEYKKVTIDDCDSEDISRHFSESHEYVTVFFLSSIGLSTMREAVGRVFWSIGTFQDFYRKSVSAAGMSRSACIVISYLMAERKIKFVEALQYLKKRHPIMGINGGFIKQLIQYEKKLLKPPSP